MRSTKPCQARLRLRNKGRKSPVFRWSAMALAVASAAGVAHAQSAQGPTEEIVITGSRIRLNGMETANPVTVVTPEQLQITAPTTMVEGLAALPQFYNSNTTENTGGFFTSAGAGSLNLRGLGTKRTLQLLDGRRVVSSTIYGGPDLNMLPQSLVRTVETQTGGATATYGTDAVGGVVNLLLDTTFEGIKGSVQTGATARGDNSNWKASIAAGFQLGDKTHLLVSGEKFDQDPIWTRDGYDWYKSWALIQNPDAANRGKTPDNPVNLLYPYVVSNVGSLDGIITFAGGAKYILDANGNPTPFVPGVVADGISQTLVNGGSGTDNGVPGAQLMPKTESQNVFTYLEHEFTDQFKVYGQLMYGEGNWRNNGAAGNLFGVRGITIYSGNPFLPASIQQMMIGTGTAAAPQFASVSLGRVGANEDLAADSWTDQPTDVTSFTGGFEYRFASDGFFNDWLVKGYYQKGKTNVEARQHGGLRIDRVYLAADAVVDGSGNTVCNVTLVSGLYPDCVPINLFGRGNASAQAIDWVKGFDTGLGQICVDGWLPGGGTLPYCYDATEDKKRVINLKQDVWEFTADGDLAKGWAGPISMAMGVAYRKESFVQYVQAPQGNPTADPAVRPVQANNAALGIRGVPGADAANSVEIQFSKVPFGIGDFDVKEAFTEFRIPLIAGKRIAKRMDLDLAYRWADYSGSGSAESWKAALEWAISDRLRFRTTSSQDVRAANLAERYDRTGGVATVTDYGEDPTGGTASRYVVTIVSGGNPTVRPESAKTYTAGIVFRSTKAENFDFSVDWYDTKLTDNINLYGVQNIVTSCHLQNNVDTCAQIERNGPPSTINPGLNRISIVNDVYVNVQQAEARGVDFELDWGKSVKWFGGSNVSLRWIGTHLLDNALVNSAGTRTDNAGVLGVPALPTGLPEWQHQLSGLLSHGPLSVTLQMRYFGDMIQSLTQNTYQANFNGGAIRYDVPADVQKIDSSLITDASVRYRFNGGKFSIYGVINNLLDKDPTANFVALSAFTGSTGNGYFGDLRGRRYSIGFNWDL
jgi:iron complex outermembrane receptor protein